MQYRLEFATRICNLRSMKSVRSIGIQRRCFLRQAATLTTFAVLGSVSSFAVANPRKGRLKQAVCKGVFKGSNLDLDGMCREAARLGAYGIDLVGPGDFATLKQARPDCDHGFGSRVALRAVSTIARTTPTSAAECASGDQSRRHCGRA